MILTKPFSCCVLYFAAFLVLSLCLSFADASVGDKSFVYTGCIRKCNRGCHGKPEYVDSNPIYMKWLGWTCREECKYDCMWHSVEHFSLTGLVPQFHGKWPFIRIYGMQEPASVAFSLLNLIAHLIGLFWIRRLSGVSAKAWMWIVFGFYSMAVWVCSAVFHARDMPLTEKLDYFGAYGLVLFSFYLAIVYTIGESGDKIWRCLTIAAMLSAFYISHIMYVSRGERFEYGYNMKVNITTGLLAAALWLFRSFSALRRSSSDSAHYKYAILAIVIGTAGLFLEVLDFIPIYWVFDAHSLWHLLTAPCTLLWYQFVHRDLLQQQETAAKARKAD